MTTANRPNTRIGISVTIVLAGIIGLALFALPDRVAAALGVEGQDELAYRAGGAAFFGYAVASLLALGASDRERRILLAATFGGGLATVVAMFVSIAGGHGLTASAVILVAALVAAVAAARNLLRTDAAGPSSTPDIETWLVSFLWWGVVASGLFGIGGLLLGATFGSLSGAAGTDDSVYRLAGAATIGILVSTLLALRSRVWQEIHLAMVLSFVTNVLTLLGGLLIVGRGHTFIGLWLVVAAAAFNSVCLGLALVRHSSR